MDPADSKSTLSIQIESQSLEPLLNRVQDQASNDISLNTSHHENKASDEADNNNALKGKIIKGSGLRLFPIFRDFGLSVFSINYALYFEFFDIIIRILFQLFFLGIFLHVFDSIARALLFPIFFQSDDQIRARCESEETQINYDSCIISTKSLVECKKYMVAAFCCVATSLFAMMFQAYLRKKEETRIINNPVVYDFNWTQDFFSVLIENIPKEATKEELRGFFNNLDSLKKIQGEVKEIISVQDISKCAHILQEIKRLEETKSQQPDNEKTVQDLKHELYHKQSELPLHDGKAIVVFDSLRTRSLVFQLFRPSRSGFLEAFIRGYDTHLAFKDSYLTAQTLPEPQNLNFENLCIPKSNNYAREILAFALNIGILTLATIAAFCFSFIPSIQQVDAQKSLFWNQKLNKMLKDMIVAAAVSGSNSLAELKSYSLPLILILIQALQDIAFQAVEKLTKRKSKTDSEHKWLNYSIYSSFFLYLFIQGLLMSFQWEDASDIAQKTIKVYCLKHLIKKLGALFFCYRKTNHPEFNDSKGIYYSIRNFIASKVFGIDMTAKDFQFKFFKEASKVFPLVAMNLAFLANGSKVHYVSSTIPITLVTLYIGAICDKYCLINQPEQSSFNSARFMLRLFKFFKADHFAFVFGALMWMGAFVFYTQEFSDFLPKYFLQKTDFTIIFAESAQELLVIVLVVIILMTGIYLFYLAVWPASESLESKFEFYFEQHKSLVSYDLVSSHFTETYRNPITSYLTNQDEKIALIL